MVRFPAAFASTVLSGLLLAELATAAAPETAVTRAEATTVGLPQAPVAKSAKRRAIRLVMCDICAGLTCTTVRVRGRCTVNKAIAALRRRQEESGPTLRRLPGPIRHRDRAVTKGDFKELTEDLPQAGQTGRAEAEPKHRPQDGTAARLLDLYQKRGRPLSVREHHSPKLNAQPFRPLDLSEEPSADDEGKETSTTGE